MSQQEAQESIALQRELVDLRRKVSGLELLRENTVTLLGIIARYHRAIRSTGAILADDEVALIESIRKDAERIE